VERGAEVDVEDEVPDVLGHRVEHLVPGDAGVVDEDVDLAEALDRPGNQRRGALHGDGVVEAQRGVATVGR